MNLEYEKIITSIVDSTKFSFDCFNVDLEKYMSKQVTKLPFLHVPWLIRRFGDVLLADNIDINAPLFNDINKKKMEKFPTLTPTEASNAYKRFIVEMQYPLLRSKSHEDVDTLCKILQSMVSDEDKVKEVSNYVKKLSVYHRSLAKELFYVCNHLYKIRKMKVDLIVCFFGSEITGQMDPSPRDTLLTYLISFYDDIFTEVDKLVSNKGRSGHSVETKDITVIYEDGKKLSVPVKLADKPSNIVSKIKQMLSTNDHLRLYHILDRQIRLVQRDEELCRFSKKIGSLLCTSKALHKSEEDGSSIDSYSDGVEAPILKLAPTPTKPPVKSDLEGSITEGSAYSDSSKTDSKVDPMKDSNKLAVDNIHNRPRTSSSDTKSGSSRHGDMETKKQKLEPNIHKVWVFTNIPEGNKSHDWDTSTSIPSELTVSLSTDPLKTQVSIKSIDKSHTWIFEGKDIFSLADSSRRFAFLNENSKYMGFGFNSRHSSGTFRECISEFIQATRK